MGEVWLCRDDALGVDRAVKFLLPERAGDAALRARFAAEARTLAALGGVPGVVRVHAAGEDPATRRPFFVMDAHLLSPEEVRAVCTRRLGLSPLAAAAVSRAVFETHAESAESAEFLGRARALRAPNPEPANDAEGGFERARSALGTPAEPAPFTLQSALGDEAAGTARQLPERAVLSLAREIAAALARLHGCKPPVVHRDLKPSNLLFAADGRLLLADFGVAKTLDAARTEWTRPGFQPGTQRYAAPELLRGDPATPAADWYSLGVVLFRALTSSFPQWGEAFPTREGLRPFSPGWEPLLRDLLAPDPARRLADRAAFSRRLDSLERSLDRPRGGRRRAKAATAALAAAVLAAGSLLVFRAASGPGETRNPASEAKPGIRIPDPVESHAESAEVESHAESAEVESHAEFAESAKHPGGGGNSGEEAPPPVAAQPSTAPGDEMLDAVREFLPAVDRIVEEHGKLLPDWNLPFSQLEVNPAAREYRLLFARRALDTAERLRRKAEAGEALSERDFSQGLVTRDTWEAWLARRRAEEAAGRKIPPASPEPGTEESEP